MKDLLIKSKMFRVLFIAGLLIPIKTVYGFKDNPFVNQYKKSIGLNYLSLINCVCAHVLAPKDSKEKNYTGIEIKKKVDADRVKATSRNPLDCNDVKEEKYDSESIDRVTESEGTADSSTETIKDYSDSDDMKTAVESYNPISKQKLNNAEIYNRREEILAVDEDQLDTESEVSLFKLKDQEEIGGDKCLSKVLNSIAQDLDSETESSDDSLSLVIQEDDLNEKVNNNDEKLKCLEKKEEETNRVVRGNVCIRDLLNKKYKPVNIPPYVQEDSSTDWHMLLDGLMEISDYKAANDSKENKLVVKKNEMPENKMVGKSSLRRFITQNPVVKCIKGLRAGVVKLTEFGDDSEQ